MKRDCPRFLAIGMTYEQYWYGDPLMARDYYEAYRIRKKEEDESAWWQGLYIYQALQATVGNLFLEEGAEPERYPGRPVLQEQEKEQAEEKARQNREKEEERERLKLVAYLNQVRAARQEMER